MISQRSRIAAESPRYWRYIYDVIELEWPRGHSDYLADHSSIQILNRPTFFGCFTEKLLVNDRI